MVGHGTVVAVTDHFCTVGTLDYGNVADGYILCTDCGRMYRFTPGKGWFANPRPQMQAATRVRNLRRPGRRGKG